jgi:hypothetical protein
MVGIMNGTTCIIKDNIKKRKSPEVDHCGTPDFKAQEEKWIPMTNSVLSLVIKPTDITTEKYKVAKQSMRNNVRRITYINLITINQINLSYNELMYKGWAIMIMGPCTVTFNLLCLICP